MIRQKAFEYVKLDRLTQLSGGSELTMEYENNGNIAYKSDAGTYTYKVNSTQSGRFWQIVVGALIGGITNVLWTKGHPYNYFILCVEQKN